MENEELTVDAAAEILGVDPSHVRWYHRKGHLPGRRIGARVLVFKRADVEALAKNKPQKTGRPPKGGQMVPRPKAKRKPKKGA
jgi:excisionase family DNA binding protein